jgi:hypothetical protein
MRKPSLLRNRSPNIQIFLAVVVPFAFGCVVGIVLGTSAGIYWILLAIAALGGLLAGLDHDDSGEALARGAIGGALFGLGILFTHQLADTEAKVGLGSFPAALIVIDAVVGALLALLGCWAFRRARGRRRATDPS